MVNSSIVVLVVGVLLGVCEGAFQTICRVDKPSEVKYCNKFEACSYIVSPVEEAENLTASNFGTSNKLFALYGGPSSCAYFIKLIETDAGRQELANTIDKKLQQCGTSGVEIGCDPGLSHANKHNYAEFLKTLRGNITNNIIAVRLSNANCDRHFVEALNKYVDLVIVDSKGCAAQLYTVQHLIANGLNPQKIVYYVSLPLVLDCSSPQPLLTIKNAVKSIDSLNLYGAYMPLDNDDAIGLCDDDGPYFLFRHLIALLEACGASNPGHSTTGCATCNSNGNGREPRDCSCCNKGSQGGKKCDKNKEFDVCSNACQPVIKINCNETTCVMTGTFNGSDQNYVPIPHPFSFQRANTTNVAYNLTIVKEHIYEFERLLHNTQLNRTIGIVNELTGPLQKKLGSLVEIINKFLTNLLGLNNAVDGASAPLGALKPLLDDLTKKLGPLLDMIGSLLESLLGVKSGPPGLPLPGSPGLPAPPAAPPGLPVPPAAPSGLPAPPASVPAADPSAVPSLPGL